MADQTGKSAHEPPLAKVPILGTISKPQLNGLTAAANVLDRRRVHNLLRLAGTELKVLDRARVLETVVPLVLAGGVTAVGVMGGSSFSRNCQPPPSAR